MYALRIVAAATFMWPAMSFAQGTGPNGAIARCANGGVVYIDSGVSTCADHSGVKEWFPAKGASDRTTGPNGAVARCRNGGLVYVSNGVETCAGFGGVAEWFAGQGNDDRAAVVSSAPILKPTSTVELLPSNTTSRESAIGPNGAVARCRDGALVLVPTGSNTCAEAGGVAEWFVPPSERTAAASTTAPSNSRDSRESKWRTFLEALGAVGAGVAVGLNNGAEPSALQTPKNLPALGAYITKIDSDSDDVLILANGAIVEVTGGYLGYVGYRKDAVLIAGRTCRIWIQGKKTFRCSVLRRPSVTGTVAVETSITEVTRGGEIIKTLDGSIFEVESIDRLYTALWLPVSEVLLLGDSQMVNLDQGDELITVSRIK